MIALLDNLQSKFWLRVYEVIAPRGMARVPEQ